MSNEKLNDCAIVCDTAAYFLVAVRLNVLSKHTNKLSGSIVANIVATSTALENEIYQTAEKSIRSWGAFTEDYDDSFGLAHHLEYIEFVPVSIERITIVHGISKADAEWLADTDCLRQFYD